MGRSISLILACAIALTLSINTANASLTFQEVSDAAGVALMHDPTGALPFGEARLNWFGPGVAWADFNGDNWLDLFVSNGQSGSKLFLNNADGTFSDGTAALGIIQGQSSNGIAMADIDNKGMLEVAVGKYFDEPLLYRGSTRNLINVAETLGLDPMFSMDNIPESMGVSFGDFNSDGFVDVYFANYRNQPDMLFENTIGGSYFAKTDKVVDTLSGWGFMGVFFDFDNDGDQDIYVANDFGMNFLFENGGAESGWELTNKAPVYSATHYMSTPDQMMEDRSMSMGLAIADYDNDLDLDIYVTNYIKNAFYRNEGPGIRGWKFKEISDAAKVPYDYNCWGTDFVDLDLDGDLDLVQTSGFIYSGPLPQPENLADKLWLNNGAPNWDFEDASDATGFNYEGMGRGLATADYDRDGDIDIVITNNTFDHPLTSVRTEGWLKLFRNDQNSSANWVNLKLKGSGEHVAGLGCNMSAIGARVYLTSGGITQMREVQAGSSYLSQNSLELEFGIGANETIDEVKVRWICGMEEVFTGIYPNEFYLLNEGDGAGTIVAVAISVFNAHPTRDGIELEWNTALGDRVIETKLMRAPAENPEFMSELPIEIRSYDGHGSAFDNTAQAGREYAYQLFLTGTDGSTIASTTLFAKMNDGQALPSRAQVGQNYPNPFNPSTTILFTLPRSGNIRLLIHDEMGRLVRSLYEGTMDLGEHKIDWDGLDNFGHSVASGVYHYSVITEQGSSSRRMTLVR